METSERLLTTSGAIASFVTVVLVAAFLCLGLFNFDFSRGWLRGQLLRLAIGAPIALVYAYLTLPPFVFPQAITLLLLTLVPNIVLSIGGLLRTWVRARRIVSIRRTPAWPPLLALAIVAAYALVLAVMPVVDANGLRDLTGAQISTAAPPTADIRHVRVVPEASAVFSGSKVVGQLGTYYRVGTYTVQAESGRLVWVAPLDYQGTVQWLSRRTSPGVVVVSAENPDAPAELRARAPMRYIPSALFNENIERHVYLRYGTELLLETTLQLDDHGDPKYLVTLGRPTIGWSGDVVTAVVIVDPTTGAMERVPREKFDSLPGWVSRVYPPDLVLAYNDWFGRYVHGWWNAQIARRDVHLPAREDVYGLLIDSGKFVWFADHTSFAATDDSMTGFTYTDSRTGAMTYYTTTGGEFNSNGAERSVQANPIIKQGQMVPQTPILYNLGSTTWVVPAVATNGKFQTLALVQAAGGRVVVGNPQATSPVADAFDTYRAVIAGGKPVTGGTASSGIIDRFSSAGGRVFFTLRGRREIFAVAVSEAAAPFALLARPGDRVTFTAGAASDGTIEARSLRVAGIGS